MRDDQGTDCPLDGPPRRVVSLVPSLTEAIAASAAERLIGATDWCTHPAGIDVVRVRGTKNPDVDRIVALQPDLVVANEEENREPDLIALRDRGIAVWVTDVRTVDGALASLGRLLEVLDAPGQGWLDDAHAAWSSVVPGPGYRAVVPIWRRPWMFLGRDTYAGDVLRRLGVVNVLADHPERYPRCALDELPAYQLVVLPDEPYRFSAQDGPEAFPGMPCALVDGRSLTWYGPAMVAAPGILRAQLSEAAGPTSVSAPPV